ncbi:hypothetical protein ACFYVL_19485 [Streptomyces sp. NPDC004111]|uniref:hypothetical protein n=1 Tax=Streptomyces sp. NPDC004111 TaxID=3364690 RepID=UPI00369E765A
MTNPTHTQHTTAPRTTAPHTTAPRTTAPRTTAPHAAAPRTTAPHGRPAPQDRPAPVPATAPRTPSGLVRPAGFTRFALVAAPVSLVVYGAVRLLSERGTPGTGWTLGHLAMLVGVLLFVPVLRQLYRSAPASRRPAASAALLVTGAGLLATAVQAAIDLVSGLIAEDRPAMREIFRQVKAVPGVEPVVYGVVPQLFFVGLVVLAALTAASVRTRILMVTALVAGTVCMAVSLDLLPVGGLCMLLALAPLLAAGRVAPLPRTN